MLKLKTGWCFVAAVILFISTAFASAPAQARATFSEVVADFQTSDTSVEVTYLALSKHFIPPLAGEDPYNTNHDFLGVEYRTDTLGIGIAKFTNSYGNTGVIIDVAAYGQPIDDWETSIRAGHVTGYSDLKFSLIGSVAYTKYPLLKPKLSLMMGALVFSVSSRF